MTVLTKRAVLREEGVAPIAKGELRVAAAMLDDDVVASGTANAAEMSLAASVHAEVADRFGVPVYARVDLVPGGEGGPVVSELELIEPALYLALAGGASERLANAVLAS
jgi:butyrate kinase